VQVGIVANPRAGRRAALEHAKSAARELGEAGHRCEIACTMSSGSASELARELAADGCELVFAAGGDGTINEVVQGLVGTGAALGVIPAGLANVWAAEFGLSSAPGAFVRLVEDGLVYDTDLGLVNGRHFLMMAGIGFDADVVAAVDGESKERWAQLAYVGQAVQCVRHWPRSVATVAVDGQAVFDDALFGIIMTNTNKYGGVIDLAPEARLDDGLVDALVYRDGGPARRVRSALFLDHRLRRWDPCVSHFTCERLSVACLRPLAVHTDAEPAGWSPCEVRVERRALPVLLPPTAQRRYTAPGRAVQARSSRSYSGVAEPTP
jgi:YegS/Rv2252/BmrU family lipid kinase